MAVSYIPQFVPTNMEVLQGNLNMYQQAHDRNVAMKIGTIDEYSQIPTISPEDTMAKNERLGGFQELVKELDEKFNYDRASSAYSRELARRISGLKQDPFWTYNQEKLQTHEARRQMQLKLGANYFETTDPTNATFENREELDNWRALDTRDLERHFAAEAHQFSQAFSEHIAEIIENPALPGFGITIIDPQTNAPSTFWEIGRKYGFDSPIMARLWLASDQGQVWLNEVFTGTGFEDFADNATLRDLAVNAAAQNLVGRRDTQIVSPPPPVGGGDDDSTGHHPDSLVRKVRNYETEGLARNITNYDELSDAIEGEDQVLSAVAQESFDENIDKIVRDPNSNLSIDGFINHAFMDRVFGDPFGLAETNPELNNQMMEELSGLIFESFDEYLSSPEKLKNIHQAAMVGGQLWYDMIRSSVEKGAVQLPEGYTIEDLDRQAIILGYHGTGNFIDPSGRPISPVVDTTLPSIRSKHVADREHAWGSDRYNEEEIQNLVGSPSAGKDNLDPELMLFLLVGTGVPSPNTKSYGMATRTVRRRADDPYIQDLHDLDPQLQTMHNLNSSLAALPSRLKGYSKEIGDSIDREIKSHKQVGSIYTSEIFRSEIGPEFLNDHFESISFADRDVGGNMFAYELDDRGRFNRLRSDSIKAKRLKDILRGGIAGGEGFGFEIAEATTTRPMKIIMRNKEGDRLAVSVGEGDNLERDLQQVKDLAGRVSEPSIYHSSINYVVSNHLGTSPLSKINEENIQRHFVPISTLTNDMSVVPIEGGMLQYGVARTSLGEFQLVAAEYNENNELLAVSPIQTPINDEEGNLLETVNIKSNRSGIHQLIETLYILDSAREGRPHLNINSTIQSKIISEQIRQTETPAQRNAYFRNRYSSARRHR